MKERITIILDGREASGFRQQAIDDQGGFWFTNTASNSDRGIALYGNGGAFREVFKDGELKSRVYIGPWKIKKNEAEVEREIAEAYRRFAVEVHAAQLRLDAAVAGAKS